MNIRYQNFFINRRYHFIFTFILTIVVTYPGYSQQSVKTRNSPFIFFQMSDPQFGMYTGNKGFERETRNFQKAISTANRLHPDFIIITGDLTNEMGNKFQMDEYHRILSTLDTSIKVYNVPGNHDVDNKPTPTSISDYRKAYGKDYYSFINKNLYGIVLNSSIIAEPDLVANEVEDQLKWLQSELKKAKAQNFSNIVIFQHIPWFIDTPDEKNMLYSADEVINIPIETRRKYLTIFKEAGVRFVFAGHYHRNRFGVDGDLQMITTGPVGMPLDDGYSGFRIVKVIGDNICYPFYGLDALPDNVQQIWRGEH